MSWPRTMRSTSARLEVLEQLDKRLQGAAGAVELGDGDLVAFAGDEDGPCRVRGGGRDFGRLCGRGSDTPMTHGYALAAGV